MHWLGSISAFVLAAALLAQQPGPPEGGPPHGPPPPPDARWVEQRIARTRTRLEHGTPVDAYQREIAAFATRFLGEARKALRTGDVFHADRMADAADACARTLEHLSGPNHMDREEGGGPSFPHPGMPDDPLRRVHFRLRMGDFFLDHIPAPKPQRLLTLAQRFYQQALQACEAGDGRKMGLYIMCADDLTHALESMAQAYAPMPPPPPPEWGPGPPP